MSIKTLLITGRPKKVFYQLGLGLPCLLSEVFSLSLMCWTAPIISGVKSFITASIIYKSSQIWIYDKGHWINQDRMRLYRDGHHCQFLYRIETIQLLSVLLYINHSILVHQWSTLIDIHIEFYIKGYTFDWLKVRPQQRIILDAGIITEPFQGKLSLFQSNLILRLNNKQAFLILHPISQI